MDLKLVICLEYQNKNIFAKRCVLNWSEEVFVITKVKNVVTNVISDLKGEEIVRTVYKKELQKTNKKEFRVEKSNIEKRR